MVKAWSVKGVSVLASGLGTPIVMDSMTASMCHRGIGNLSYARVLLEMDATKELKNEIEIQKCKNGGVVNNNNEGLQNVGTSAAENTGNEQQDNSSKFVTQGRKKISKPKNFNNQNSQQQKQVNGSWRMENKKHNGYKDNRKNNAGNNVENNKWKVKEKVVENLRNTANKFSVLDTLPDDNDQELRTLKIRMVVDKFLNEKVQPALKESINWTRDMIDYFKTRWEEDRQKESEDTTAETYIEDVLEVNTGTAKVMGDNEISGWDNDDTSVQVLYKTNQSIFCVVSADKYKFKSFYTFVYAANEGLERRRLWEELIKENNFQDCLNKIEIKDICRTGLHFTWTKNLERTKAGNMTGILKKLDRVMSNEVFIHHFLNVHATFLPYIISDHTSSVLCIPTVIKKKTKAFKFSNYLTDKQEFMHIVRDKWSQNVQGYHMYQVVQKLKSLKTPLNKLGWSKGNLFKRVESLRGQLQKIQTEIDNDPHNLNLREIEAVLVKDFHEAEEDEEKFLFQQAKIQWLSDGDKNSSYFHRVLKGRNNRSKILKLNDDNGVSYENEQIPLLFLKHFKDFLGKSHLVQEIEDCESLFQSRISEDVAAKMITNVPDKEIKEFFGSGKMLGEINATLITLIPKVQTPSKVTDFRPIACCNVLYKCISKIITNRIKPVLGGLVSCNQSAFIPGRTIQDNILLTQELMRGYDRKGGPKRVAIKINLQKAYDISHARIPYHLIYSLYTCEFSISLMREEKLDKTLSFFIPYFKAQLVYLLVMCHGDPNSVRVIKRSLDEFSTCSGLIPNNSKSTMFFGSVCEEDKEAISSVLPFAIGKLPVKYLGVPLIAKRLSVKDCGSLIDKIKSKVKNWKIRCLSYAGRLQLIAAVLESIHVIQLKVKQKLPGRLYAGLRIRVVHSVKLRGKSIWEISPDIADSWGWKYLLTIRDIIMDNVISLVDLYDARLRDNMTLKEMVSNGQLMWPQECRNGVDMSFSVSIAYSDMNTQFPMVQWWKVIWFSQCIPKHSFIVWLAIQDRLTTMDKISKWGDYAVNRCSLCCQACEDINHLLFQCPFSREVWTKVKELAGFNFNRFDLMDIIYYMIDAGIGNNIRSIVRRVAFSASIYNIWIERNGRIFRDVKRSCEDVINKIVDTVKHKIIGLTVKDSPAVRDIEKIWVVSCKKYKAGQLKECLG
ncbi:RNA-directed DNA polymerase, eukaryota, reverse transcriptase zinc-binding domain protein [Tanacetum coccineum]